MNCQICGRKVSASDGEDTTIGFVCNDCFYARDFKSCIECGRKFPRDEMVEWNGLFYCRSDYFGAMERLERIRAEERKKKEMEEEKKRQPQIKPVGSLGVKIKRKEPISSEEIRQLLKEQKIEHRKLEQIKSKDRLGTGRRNYESIIQALRKCNEPNYEVRERRKLESAEKENITKLLEEIKRIVRGKSEDKGRE
ncbi:MAG: hypothetical protein NZ903_00960 [Candidatus Micrarchaeota archaeon]|nr:hypothetical protein [Candidatus Micrarchaeota archaeon]